MLITKETIDNKVSFTLSFDYMTYRFFSILVPVEIININNAEYDHFDFLLAEGCGLVVNKHVIEQLEY